MMTTEDRVRRVADSIEVSVGERFEAGVQTRIERFRRRRRLGAAGGLAAVMATIVAIAVVVHTPGHAQQTVVETPSSTVSTSIAKFSLTLPADISGTEEVLRPAPPFDPQWLTGGDPARQTIIVPGTAHAFTVGGTPTFEVADVRSPPPPSDPKGPRTPGMALFYVGVGGYSGTGFDGSFQPLPTVDGSPVQIVPQWPTPHQQLYAWTHLPNATAYVTYSYVGTTLAWERPVSGVIAVLVARPAAFDGNYAVWHTAPLPIMRAYDIQGHLLKQVELPRIGNDDLKMATA